MHYQEEMFEADVPGIIICTD